MADTEARGGGSGWLGFIAGIIVVALLGVVIYVGAGAGRPQQTAQLELNVPDVKINPPDVNLPSPPPAPVIPPAANSGG